MRAISLLAMLVTGVVITKASIAQLTGYTAPAGQTLPWGSTVVVSLDETWKDVRRSAQPGSDTEPALAKFSNRASREGSVLYLRLEGDRVLKIFNEGVCDGFATCLHHYLRDRWPRLHYYVVEFTHGENGWAYLIRESDGLVIRVAHTPVLSPNSRYAIASNPGIDGRTELLDMRPDPPTIHPIDAPSSCPGQIGFITLGSNPVWIDNSRVMFDDAWVMFKNDTRKVRLTLQIVDGQPQWQC
ncbi:MAG: hypothetical protein FD144_930 [Rhodospirillaceae bacterium]|nr:MAG: hypothetical protein FD144_930 [Rhodospirillaceae bacterium]